MGYQRVSMNLFDPILVKNYFLLDEGLDFHFMFFRQEFQRNVLNTKKTLAIERPSAWRSFPERSRTDYSGRWSQQYP